MFKKIFHYFLQGLLYTAPLGITLYIVFVVFNFIDSLITVHIEEWLHIKIPGLGLVLLLVFFTLAGIIGKTIIAQPIRILTNSMINRTPIIKAIYSSLTDLFKAFVGKEKRFNQPVLVKVNTISDLEKIGFITQHDLSDLGIIDKMAVYFPHSYNFSGELFIVPSQNIRPLDIPAAEAMKFVVSGGITRLVD